MRGQHILPKRRRVSVHNPVVHHPHAAHHVAPQHQAPQTSIQHISAHHAAPKKVRKIKNYAVLYACVALCAMAAFALVVWQANKSVNNGGGKSAESEISTTLVAQAAPVLATNDTNELGELVQKAQKLQSYSQNQDLLYVALNYYVRISNVADARKTLDQLQKITGSSKDFTAVFGANAKSIAVLTKDVEFLESIGSQYIQNAKLLPAE